jgi:transposase
VEVVESLGVPIHVGHALKMRLIAQARIKTDKVDARVIAQLLRADFFPRIAIPPAEIRQVRELLRGRVRMGRGVTQMKNRLHGVLTRAGIEYEKKELLGPGAKAFLEGVNLAPAPKFMALEYLSALRDLQRRCARLKKEIGRQVRPREPWAPVVRRLMTIPGIGELSAMLFLLELWDVERFPDVKHLASYVGMVPSVSQTGKQTPRGGPLTRQGNVYVRWALVQDAWVAVRYNARYRRMHEHYTRRQGRSRAIIPVARLLLADVYQVWRDGIDYDELIARRTAGRKRA